MWLVLTYGCQTWSLSHRLKQMIQVCQQKVERKITHVTLRDGVRCEDLRRSTGMRDASNLAERLKWKWSNHVARITTDGHRISPCGTPEKAEGTWGDNGRDGLTSSKDLWATNGPEVRKTECCGKYLKKKTLTL